MKILGCPPFLKYITPNYSPMMWGKIWNVHKNIRTLHKDHKKQKWNGDLVILAEKWWIFTFLTPKSPPKPPKITFSKNPKKRFLLVPRRVLIPNFKSLCRKLRPGAPGQTHRQTHRHTDKKLKKGEYFSTSLEQTRGRNESVEKVIQYIPHLLHFLSVLCTLCNICDNSVPKMCNF